MYIPSIKIDQEIIQDGHINKLSGYKDLVDHINKINSIDGITNEQQELVIDFLRIGLLWIGNECLLGNHMAYSSNIRQDFRFLHQIICRRLLTWLSENTTINHNTSIEFQKWVEQIDYICNELDDELTIYATLIHLDQVHKFSHAYMSSLTTINI